MFDVRVFFPFGEALEVGSSTFEFSWSEAWGLFQREVLEKLEWR